MDVYVCPAEKELTYRFTSFEKGMNIPLGAPG
ncbi:MAG: hypothetical protein ACI845_000889 [Gammaproteobacteria bacterium]|jgi:hypothetical protein